MAHWHPILSAEERTPGVWTMVAAFGHVYGTIRFVRRGNEVGYRADDKSSDLVGYYRTILAAVMAAHKQCLSSLTPGGAINGM